MAKRENTPFVIDFKPKSAVNYGSAEDVANRSTAPRDSTTHNSLPSVSTRPSKMYVLHGRRTVELRDHCHKQRTEGIDLKARKKLIIASVLCLVFMVCEIVGGILSNSLAIATDAAHLLTDFASFMISLFAIYIAARPSTQRMSFGWYRAEVIGAMGSVVMIWVITGILVWLAAQRLINNDFEVDAKIMLITSGLAILVNLIMGLQLQHGHSHGGTSAQSHGMVSDRASAYGAGGEDTARTKKAVEDHKVAGELSQWPLSTDEPKPSRATVPGPTCTPTGRCRILENSAIELEATETAVSISGRNNVSYQNSVSVKEVQAQMGMATKEMAPGPHHHDGAAGHEQENLNVRAAFIHVVGDMIQSTGVFVAALIIFFRPDWAIVDPICTFFFSIIVLCTTFAIMKDALLVLMEGTPSYLHYTEVLEVFESIDGVTRVHNLRIWALSINKVALSVHLAIAPGASAKRILEEATFAVHRRYNLFETTIQIEDFTPQMETCKQCCVPAT